MSERVGLRGRAWFRALTGTDQPRSGDPGSVLTADTQVGQEAAVFLCVVPNPDGRFPCVRDGQVGLALAARTREAIEADRDKPKAEKRPIIAIVDVKSQAYRLCVPPGICPSRRLYGNVAPFSLSGLAIYRQSRILVLRHRDIRQYGET
jgi:Malonate decarboxylase gamma subunit (MdcE)